MVDDSATSGLESSNDAWHEIDVLLDEIGRLSRSDRSATDFLKECLSRIVTSLDAAGGVVWTRDASGDIQPACHLLPLDAEGAHPQADACRRRLVSATLAEGKARTAMPQTAASGETVDVNPTPFSLTYCPWSIENETLGVFEIFHRPGASPKTQRGYLELIEVVCGLVEDFYRRGQLRQYRQWATDWKALQEFAVHVHRSLDLTETAFAVANEGRRLIGCDRISVLVQRRKRFRLVATSGVASVNERANVVRGLERLGAAACRLDEPLWYPDMADDLPPEVERLASAHLDESHARALLVQPLRPSQADPDADHRELVGALIAESYYGGFDERACRNLTTVHDASARALGNALEVSRVPFLRLLQSIERTGGFVRARRLPTVLALLVVALCILTLAVIRADFCIEARGQLQPVRIRDTFAPVDGVVDETTVGHGDRIDVGDVLVRLRSSELDFQFSQVWGELQTAREELTAVEAERTQDLRERDERQSLRSQLTARREELGARIGSLQEQYAILQQQRAELEVRSPIAGELLTWNLDQLLDARPVNRGQILATIGDLDGPWHLELRIPDRRVAHVLAARKESSEILNVTFILATEPGRRLHGTLDWVGSRTEISELDGAFVPAKVAINRNELPQRVPGAGITAKIYCGRRALGYVWFHDLWDAMQSWFLF